jgi:uncharacterized membrane protein
MREHTGKPVALYLVLLGSFLLIDGVWLTLVAKRFYTEQIGYLLTSEPNYFAAGLFYLVFVLALQVFVVQPGLSRGSLGSTLQRAAFFGFVTYATYDLTNLATVRDWPVLVTVVDLVWGAFLSVAVSAPGYLIARRRGW